MPAQRNLATKKRAELEATCAGFLTLFATLHRLDDPEYPKDELPGYLAFCVANVVPNIAATAPELRAEDGFAGEVKRICDLFVGAQELFPADGSKLEEIREWTRRWAKSASRLHRAWTALLVLFLSMLIDYSGELGFVRRNLEDVGFGTPVISGTGMFVPWRGREERDIEPHLRRLEEQCKVLKGASHDALENAWREAVTAYQKSLCEGVTGLRFENGVLVETIGETSRKRRGQGRAGSAVAEAAQQALPPPGAGPDAPILIEDEEIPDADEPFIQNPDTDTSRALQNHAQTGIFEESWADFLAVQEENVDFAPGTDDFAMGVDGPPNAAAAAEIAPAPAPAPAPSPPLAAAAVAVVANPEFAPLDRHAQPYEVPEVYEPTVLQQQYLQQQPQQQHLLPIPLPRLQQQQQYHHLLPQHHHQQHQHPQQQMMQQPGNFAMPATANPYTQTNMGMGMNMNMGMGQAAWQQAPQPQYQQAFGNAAYTPFSGNMPAGMGFNVAMPQQQMATAQQQMPMPTEQHQHQHQHEQPQYPPALYQQLWRMQKNAWRYAQLQ